MASSSYIDVLEYARTIDDLYSPQGEHVMLTNPNVASLITAKVQSKPQSPAPNSGLSNANCRGKAKNTVLRMLVVGLASACISSVPSIASADGPLPGGWYLDKHLTWDEWLANKATTTTLANAPSKACAALGPILPPVGPVLAAYCLAQVSWWKGVARDALQQNRCFRIVVPAHNPNWAYPSTHARSWCR
jgi:hypothetical protein